MNARPHELLMAEGPTTEGPTMFYAQYRGQPEDAAEAVSRIFLGTQLQCARCHDHPFDKWKQTDFYGLAGFFVRLSLCGHENAGKRALHRCREEQRRSAVHAARPRTRSPARRASRCAPRFLGGDTLEEPPLPEGFKEPDLKGRSKTTPKPLFSRKEKVGRVGHRRRTTRISPRPIVNRVWAQFMGRGLVDPVDDLRVNRQPAIPQLFQAMQEQFVAAQVRPEMADPRTGQQPDLSAGSRSAGGSDAAPERLERRASGRCPPRRSWPSSRTATGFDDRARRPPGPSRKPPRCRMNALLHALFRRADQRPRRLPARPDRAPVPQQQRPPAAVHDPGPQGQPGRQRAQPPRRRGKSAWIGCSWRC